MYEHHVHQRSVQKCSLIEKEHYKAVNRKHPDFVLSNADTSIKVTILQLTFAVYPFSEYYECTQMQMRRQIFNYFHFLDMKGLILSHSM